MDRDRDTIRTIAARLRRARSVLFITGAGISADSGLPTYRGVGGLYAGGTTEDGLPIEVALSGDMLTRRPEYVWRYLMQIAPHFRGARPNDAHAVIARFQDHIEQVTVLTQNVDGLHREAGSRDVIEIHGTLDRVHCMDCSFERSVRDYAELPWPPRCPVCAGWLRPRAVFFGEELPLAALHRLEAAQASGPDLVFSIGTTSVFPYIAEPMYRAHRRGGMTVEINPELTEVSHWADFRLPQGAAQAMQAIWSAYEQV